MASATQKQAAKQNVKKAARAARRKRTIAHLPRATRTALGKQAAKFARIRILKSAEKQQAQTLLDYALICSERTHGRIRIAGEPGHCACTG